MSWLFVWTVAEWIVRVVMVVLILRRGFLYPVALAWLTLVFFSPELGMLLYLLVGDNRLGRRRVRLHKQIIAAMRSEQWRASLDVFSHAPELDPVQAPMMLQAEAAGGMPVVRGNSVELSTDYDQVIDWIVRDIDAATRHVHLLFYIYAPDQTGRRVTEALGRAVKRGVTCRLLADAAGSRGLFAGRDGLLADLRGGGVQVWPTLPVAPLRRRLARLDLRNHRKLAVIDGRVAFTGSQNIVNADVGHARAGRWVDLMARVTGPAVHQLQIVFLEDWAFETDEELSGPDLFPTPSLDGEVIAQVVPTGPSHESENFNRVLLTAINASRRKIIMTSPYLVPDEPTLVALAMAADRGVEVALVLPRRSDHPLVHAAGRASYLHLLESGIHIHHHTRGLLHAKTLSVDDAFALVGSANLDVRSFYLNFELNLLLYGPDITGKLRFAQTRYLSESEPVTLEQWRRRPALHRYTDAAAALMSPLL